MAGALLPVQIEGLKTGVPLVCQQVTAELKEAVDRGTLSEQEALEIFERCIQAYEA